MKKNIITLFLVSISFTAFNQTIVSVNKLKTYTVAELFLRGVFTAQYDVDLYHVIYNTIDVNGNPTIASGALAVPVLNCDSFPLINYNHGTVLLKDDVPSRMSGEEFVGLATSSEGAISTMPDYLGLGDSPGLHPYQHAESEATATIDMMRASRTYVQDSLGLNFNGQVFLTGYSQGGHAAMATHKYIQEEGLTNEFNVVASAPASGAYDMSETTADFVFSAAYSNPGYIVYLIEAYQLAYGNLYANKADYYKAPYNTLILPYLTGDSTMSSLNAVLPALIDSLIEDSVLANYKADTVNFNHPLRQALRDNDVYDWTPQVPIEMSYCEADEQVPFQNSVKTADVMTTNGASKVFAKSRGALFNHGQCVVPSLTAVQSFFNELKKDCISPFTGIQESNLELSVDIFPNPASTSATLKISTNFPQQIDGQLLTIEGKKVIDLALKSGENTLDIRQLNPGIYLVQVTTRERNAIQKLVVRR